MKHISKKAISKSLSNSVAFICSVHWIHMTKAAKSLWKYFALMRNFQFPGYLFKWLYFTKQWKMFVVISPSASILNWSSSSVAMLLYLLDPGVSQCWVDLWRMWKRGPVAALGLDELLPPSWTHEAWNTVHNKSLNGRSHTQQQTNLQSFTINESWHEQQRSVTRLSSLLNIR